MPGSPKRRARKECNRALVLVPQPEERLDRWGEAYPKNYRDWMPERAKELCAEGATQKEVAEYFGIAKSTLQQWSHRIPELKNALKLGNDLAMDRLERTAYEMATGYTLMTKQIIKLKDERGREMIEEREVEVMIPPNSDMLKWLLKNRRPDDWKDKTETVHSGTIEHVPIDLAREKLAARLNELRIASQPKDG